MASSQASGPAVSSSTMGTKKRRRRNMCAEVERWTEPHELKVDKNIGVASDKETSKLFAQYIGKLIKDLHTFDVLITDWRKIDEAKIQYFYDQLSLKFELGPVNRDWINNKAATPWKKWRSWLRTTYYYKYNNDDERCLPNNAPNFIDPDRWKKIVEQWSSAGYQAIVKRNKVSRAAYDGLYHHMGSTSTTVNVSLRIPEEQDRYRIDSWEAQMVDDRETWTFKPADEARRIEYYTHLEHLREDASLDMDLSDGDEHSVNKLSLEDQAYFDVFGREGHNTCPGTGLTPKILGI